MSASCVLRRAFLSLAVFAGSVIAASAQGVGGIAGTVTDASGAVLPGATVTLTSAQGTVGGNREVFTDERGAYQFLRLVPGTYSVKASLQGFRPFTQAGITVNSDQTSRADARLEIGTMEEGIVVSGEAPLLDTSSALKQTVLTQEVLESLPNRMDVWAITRVIPSITVSKVDVGGSESFLQSGVTVRGHRQRGRLLHRRDGRVEPRRRGRRRHDVSRSVRVRRKQFSGGQQSGRVAARRPRVQHGDQDRHESISRRRDVQRRQ